MIKGFKDKETEKLFNRQRSKKLPPELQRRALIKLNSLHFATELSDLLIPPLNRMEALKGARKGQYSIRINEQWRICFTWEKGAASDVEIIDYHR